MTVVVEVVEVEVVVVGEVGEVEVEVYLKSLL